MIIVTGAGGNVGRQLVSRLREAGAPLRACFNSARKAAEARAAGIDAAVLDYAQPETLGPALAGGEKLFLLSPPERTELEPGVVEAARRAGTRKISGGRRHGSGNGSWRRAETPAWPTSGATPWWSGSCAPGVRGPPTS